MRTMPQPANAPGGSGRLPSPANRVAAASARVGEEKQAKELLARLYRIGPDGDGYLRGLEGLLAFRYEHLNLVGYKSHGKIEAPVAV